MKTKSAVNFNTNSRIHIGLAVSSLERSVKFYRTLLGHEPTKIRPGYAKFETVEPSVNLSLNEVGGATGPKHSVSHFGVQVKSTEAVEKIADRMKRDGVETKAEMNVTCCHAVQDKVWATDPDGNPWEVYVVLDNDPKMVPPTSDACSSDMPVGAAACPCSAG